MIPFYWKVLENQHRNGSPWNLVNFVDLKNAIDWSSEVHYIRHDVIVNLYPMFFFLCNNWTHYLAIHDLYFLELRKASKQGWGENKYQIIIIYYFNFLELWKDPTASWLWHIFSNLIILTRESNSKTRKATHWNPIKSMMYWISLLSRT